MTQAASTHHQIVGKTRFSSGSSRREVLMDLPSGLESRYDIRYIGYTLVPPSLDASGYDKYTSTLEEAIERQYHHREGCKREDLGISAVLCVSEASDEISIAIEKTENCVSDFERSLTLGRKKRPAIARNRTGTPDIVLANMVVSSVGVTDQQSFGVVEREYTSTSGRCHVMFVPRREDAVILEEKFGPVLLNSSRERSQSVSSSGVMKRLVS